MPIIRDIFYGAASQGASLKKLCASLGISVDDLLDSEKSVPFNKAYRAWELALEQTHDPLLGLHIGETSTPSIMGLIGHLMQSSRDLLTAYQQVCDHASLATDMFTYSLHESKRQVLLTYAPAKSWISISRHSARQAVEQAMAGTLNVFYLLSGKKIRPVAAELSFSRPKSTAEYERIFGSVSFGKKRNVLVFEVDSLLTPVISYDKSLFALFNNLIAEKINGLKHKNSITYSVRKILAEDFMGQIIPAELVAAHLHMSLRTFQRKLKDEGTSYRQVAKNLRKELATQLLKKSGSRVQEVSRMLGYSEASALRKALRD